MHATGSLRAGPSTRRRRGPGPPTRRETNSTKTTSKRVDPGACMLCSGSDDRSACCVCDYEAHGPVRRHGRPLCGSVRPSGGHQRPKSAALWLTFRELLHCCTASSVCFLLRTTKPRATSSPSFFRSSGNKACNARIATSLSVNCTVRARPVKHATVRLLAVKDFEFEDPDGLGTQRHANRPIRRATRVKRRPRGGLSGGKSACRVPGAEASSRYVPSVGCTPFPPATPRWPPRARTAYRPRQVGPAARDRHRAGASRPSPNGQIRLTAPSGRADPGRRIRISSPRPRHLIFVRARERPTGVCDCDRIQSASGCRQRRAGVGCERKRGTGQARGQGGGCGGGVPSDGEVHAQQVQGGRGRGGRRRRGHAGRRRPDEVQVRGGDRRRCHQGRPEEEEAAGASERGGGKACGRGHWGRRKLLHPSAKPHAVHGTASAAAIGSDAGGGCWCRTAGRGARGRALALLQHGVLGRRRGPEQEPRLRLRRCGGCRGSRPGCLGKQLGERPSRPREERDDAIELGARRAQRSGVGSGGAQDYWPVVADVGCGADRATGTRDRGVLRSRRGGPGQALRFQVQLRLRPRRAPRRRRPVRVDAGGQHLKRACGAR